MEKYGLLAKCRLCGQENVNGYFGTGWCFICTDKEIRNRVSRYGGVMTRRQAREAGRMKYYTGKVCANGHVSQRYVSSGICCDCNSQNVNASRTRKNQKRASGFVPITLFVWPGDAEKLRAAADHLAAMRLGTPAPRGFYGKPIYTGGPMPHDAKPVQGGPEDAQRPPRPIGDTREVFGKYRPTRGGTGPQNGTDPAR